MADMLPWVIRREVQAIYEQRGMPMLRVQWNKPVADHVLADSVAHPIRSASDRTRAAWLEKYGTYHPEVGLVVVHHDDIEGRTTMLVWGKDTETRES